MHPELRRVVQEVCRSKIDRSVSLSLSVNKAKSINNLKIDEEREHFLSLPLSFLSQSIDRSAVVLRTHSNISFFFFFFYFNFSKYTRRFNSSSSLKPGHRRKPSGHSDGYPSDLETCVTGSFDPIPRAQPVQTRKSRPFHRPAIHRSATIASGEHFDHILPYRRPSTKDPSIISKVNRSREEMGRHYQTGFVHPNRSSQRMYHSSVYIDHQAHSERKRSNEDLHHYHRRSSQGEKPIVSPHPDQQLYLDPNTGTI